MNEARAKQLFVELAKAAREARAIDVPLGPVDQSLAIRGGLILYGPAAAKYFDTLDELDLMRTPEDSWSRNSLDELLAVNLLDVLSVADWTAGSLAHAAQQFQAALTVPPTTFRVDLSVFGLDQRCESLSFGAFTFIRGSYKAFRHVPRFLNKDEELQVLYASTPVNAVDEDTARSIARLRLDRHLAVLNALCSDASPSRIRLSREYLGGYAYSLSRVFRPEQSQPLETLHGCVVARMLPREEFESAMQKRGGGRVSELLENPTDFASHLIAAFETAGIACVEDRPHVAFLLFAIALESSVSKKESELTFQLSVRTAHLLSSSLTGRKQAVRFIKKLYKQRSQIVHTGSTTVTPSDLAEMRSTCLSALSVLATSADFATFNTVQELDNWFEDRVLESPEYGSKTDTRES